MDAESLDDDPSSRLEPCSTKLPQAGRSGRCSCYKPPTLVSRLQEPNKTHHSQMQERAQCCQFHRKGRAVPHRFCHLSTLLASLSSHRVIHQHRSKLTTSRPSTTGEQRDSIACFSSPVEADAAIRQDTDQQRLQSLAIIVLSSSDNVKFLVRGLAAFYEGYRDEVLTEVTCGRIDGEASAVRGLDVDAFKGPSGSVIEFMGLGGSRRVQGVAGARDGDGISRVDRWDAPRSRCGRCLDRGASSVDSDFGRA